MQQPRPAVRARTSLRSCQWGEDRRLFQGSDPTTHGTNVFADPQPASGHGSAIRSPDPCSSADAFRPDRAPGTYCLADKDHPVLLVRLCVRFWSCGKLQHCGGLSLGEAGKHHDFAIWQLKRVMMRVRHGRVHLPKDCCLIALEATICVDRPIEREFGARQNANCGIWVAPGEQNPRVPKPKLRVTSFSACLAGRDCTCWRL